MNDNAMTNTANNQETTKKVGGGHTPTRDSLIHADIKAGEKKISVGIEGTAETVLALLAAITDDVTFFMTKSGVPGPIAVKFVIDAVTRGLIKAATRN